MVGQFTSRLFGPNSTMTASFSPLQQVPDRSQIREIYGMLDVYYGQNALYDQLRSAVYAQGMANEGVVALRNPVYRVVEAYVKHVWPGTLPDALPIVSDNDRLDPAIQKVFQWSNWSARKQVAVRRCALHGDLFIKVEQTDDKSRVYFQIIKPHYVSALEADERGVLMYLRIDVPRKVRQGDTVVNRYHTEVWSQDSFRLWVHDRPNASVEELGAPSEEIELTAFGIDFIPIVHIPLRDIGEDRGIGAVTHALDKIDEANRIATRLHRMFYRNSDALWAVESDGVDADGRPLPPARLGRGGKNRDEDTLVIGGDTIVRLPSMWHLKTLVPPVPFREGLDILNAHMDELMADMPELAFYEIRHMGVGQLSGRALLLLLQDAVANIEEARGNLETGLIRATQMALTIAKNAGIADFTSIGAYESGDFDFTFKPRPVITVGEDEEAQLMAQMSGTFSEAEKLRRLGYSDVAITQIEQERGRDKAQEAELAASSEQSELVTMQALLLKKQIGVPQRQLFREMGYTDAQIAQMENDQRDESANALTAGDALLTAFNRGQGGGMPADQQLPAQQPPAQQPPPPPPQQGG